MTQDAYNSMASNYNNLPVDKQVEFTQSLSAQYGANMANAIVKTFTPNMDAYNDYLKLAQTIFPEGQKVVGMDTNYDSQPQMEMPMGAPANFDESVDPAMLAQMQAQQEGMDDPSMMAPPNPTAVETPTVEDTAIMDAVNDTILELQAMGPQAAAMTISNLQSKVGEDKSFSEGLTIIYNEKDTDFSQNLAKLVSKYYKNLNLMRRSGVSDFSEVQSADLYEYNCFKRPSDFSLLRTTSKIACQLRDFSDELEGQAPSMIANVTNAIDQGQVEALAYKLEDLYDRLPSEGARDYMMTKLMSLLQSPDPNASIDMAELVPESLGGAGEELPPETVEGEGEEGEAPAENPDPTQAEIDAQLSNSDQVNALIEKYKSLNNDAEKAAMRAAMEAHPGIGPRVAEYVVRKAEGQEFSEEGDVPAPEASLGEIADPSYGEPDLGMMGVEVMDEKLEASNPQSIKDETFKAGSLDDLASVIDGDEFADELPAPEGTDNPIVSSPDTESSCTPSPEAVNAEIDGSLADIY